MTIDQENQLANRLNAIAIVAAIIYTGTHCTLAESAGQAATLYKAVEDHEYPDVSPASLSSSTEERD